MNDDGTIITISKYCNSGRLQACGIKDKTAPIDVGYKISAECQHKKLQPATRLVLVYRGTRVNVI